MKCHPPLLQGERPEGENQYCYSFLCKYGLWERHRDRAPVSSLDQTVFPKEEVRVRERSVGVSLRHVLVAERRVKDLRGLFPPFRLPV